MSDAGIAALMRERRAEWIRIAREHMADVELERLPGKAAALLRMAAEAAAHAHELTELAHEAGVQLAHPGPYGDEPPEGT